MNRSKAPLVLEPDGVVGRNYAVSIISGRGRMRMLSDLAMPVGSGLEGPGVEVERRSQSTPTSPVEGGGEWRWRGGFSTANIG